MSELNALFGENVHPYSRAVLSSVFNVRRVNQNKKHPSWVLFILVEPTGVEPVSKGLLI